MRISDAARWFAWVFARPTVHASELPMLAGLVNELNTREICSSLAVTPMSARLLGVGCSY